MNYLAEIERLSAERTRLIEAAQRERDRAQAIIHHVMCGGTVRWGMFLKEDGTPDTHAMHLVGSEEERKQRIARLRREKDDSPQSRKELE